MVQFTHQLVSGIMQQNPSIQIVISRIGGRCVVSMVMLKYRIGEGLMFGHKKSPNADRG